MKVAIIGSGISGLTCGYLLSRKHEVHLFEASGRIGGHTHTVKVQVPSGEYAVDTGFIVFNEKNYPLFTRLMQQIGVLCQPSLMSFSVKAEKSGLEYNGTSLNSLFCQRRNLLSLSFHRMIKDILRFNKQATTYYLEQVKKDAPDDITLEDWLKKNKYGEEFLEHYIIPMGAALWSASRSEMRQFPLNFFVRFFHHHGMLSVDDRPQWKVLKGGSHSYIAPLTAPFLENIHLSSPVDQVKRVVGGVELTVNGKTQFFDQVVFACHADQALRLLKDPGKEESSIIGAFSYRPNDVLLHTDTSILPQSKLGVASWNYYLPKVERERVAVTYNMNILQTIQSPETFLVSLNMDSFIDPKKVLKTISYSHPVFDRAASNAQAHWKVVSGMKCTHYCGAYWGNGFHEDGVRSAVQVAGTFGIGL